ncbi:DsbA family oxidoreductase [Marinobacter confluentis]|uniref:DsbA family oxidoreductase n=1 Tax=Marinobacter confluentis TaxID=1697557 RepID=A0A4Z1BD67_9GAMM|nr:DsbA family oxidoreductase [Marinobacter confluentis]TGN40194.1 DsbA family oxidoreductase [Marinobacter confluentis]
MTTLQIDIVSDIACPWCAIGYARLEKAMAALNDEMDFAIEWHSFELNPDPAADAEPILPALARKYGRSEDEVRDNQSQMMVVAKELGLNFEKLQERYTRNTFDAHRLVKWAGEQGKQTDMKMACFEAYFGRAENISDSDVLVACAESAGLDGNEARAVLSSDRYADAVREDEAKYQQAGVSAVPAYIINQTYLISGAQEPETLTQAFREISEEI